MTSNKFQFRLDSELKSILSFFKFKGFNITEKIKKSLLLYIEHEGLLKEYFDYRIKYVDEN